MNPPRPRGHTIQPQAVRRVVLRGEVAAERVEVADNLCLKVGKFDCQPFLLLYKDTRYLGREVRIGLQGFFVDDALAYAGKFAQFAHPPDEPDCQGFVANHQAGADTGAESAAAEVDAFAIIAQQQLAVAHI